MNAIGGFPVSLLGLKPESHMNAADHEYIVLEFYLTQCFPNQAFVWCIDLTRLQRASKGSRQSTCRGSNNVIKRCGAGFRDSWRNSVMLGDGAVDAENDRLRLGREIRFTHRAFYTFDSDFRSIHDFGHKSSSSIRRALKLRRSTLTIQTFILEAPYERHVFRNIAPTIVARLVAERSVDDHFPG